MTDDKLIKKIQELSNDCTASHPAVAVHLALVSAAVTLGGPAVAAVSAALLPLAQTMLAANETASIIKDMVICTCSHAIDGGELSVPAVDPACPVHGEPKEPDIRNN